MRRKRRRIEVTHVADPLTSLWDKSLVVYNEATGRYRVLETVRDYAAERLAQSWATGGA